MSSIHQFSVKEISGDTIQFADFKGKKILVVNVASECGYTPQYQQLQELYEEFHHKLEIIGFPSNDFGGQEPGTSAEIQTFCQTRFGVTFPLAEKVNIKGEHPHPVYQWLTQEAQNGRANHEVKWNFHKFFLDEEGHIMASFPSSVSPFDDRILEALADK